MFNYQRIYDVVIEAKPFVVIATEVAVATKRFFYAHLGIFGQDEPIACG